MVEIRKPKTLILLSIIALILSVYTAQPVHAINDFVNQGNNTLQHVGHVSESAYTSFSYTPQNDVIFDNITIKVKSPYDLVAQGTCCGGIYRLFMSINSESNFSADKSFNLDLNANVNLTEFLSLNNHPDNIRSLGNDDYLLNIDSTENPTLLAGQEYFINFYTFNNSSFPDRYEIYYDNNGTDDGTFVKNGFSFFPQSDASMIINDGNFGTAPILDSINITKESPAGNPSINQQVLYTVDYNNDSNKPYVYFTREQAEGYELHSSTASGQGIFQFLASYEYSATWQPSVQLRSTPIGIAGDSLTDFLNIEVTDQNTDNTEFSVNRTSVAIGETAQFTWSLSTTIYDTYDSVYLDVGLPSNLQAPIELTSSFGTYDYTYNSLANNVNIYPKLLVTKDGNTTEYLRSMFLNNQGVQNPASLDLLENGGSTIVDNQLRFLATSSDSYDITNNINFTYKYDNLPNHTYVSTDFYFDLDASPVAVSTTSGVYDSFDYQYTGVGIFTPRITLNYTNNDNGNPVTIDVYLGGGNSSITADTITITDFFSYCSRFPFFTNSGVFAFCEQLNIELPLPSFINTAVNFPIYGMLYGASFVFSIIEESFLYQIVEGLIDPPSGTYNFDTTPFGTTLEAGQVSYIPESTTIVRRDVNSNNLDRLIFVVISLLLVTYTFRVVSSYLR